ncbi:hypothetical protein [Pseudomonas cerasi]
MNKFGILALTAMITLITACDDATKENIKEEADKRTSSLVESAQTQWDETRKQATDLADAKVAELNAAQPLAEAKKKMNELGEMKLSDFISGGEEEKEGEEAESEKN